MRLIEENINENVTSAFSSIWTSNAKWNAHNLKCKDVKSLRKILPQQKKVAFVCGSGVSLETALPFIKKYRDSLCVYCADTAFPVLYKAGIIPEFCATIDPSDSLSKCFNFMRGKDKVDTHLIFSVLASPEVTKSWRGNVISFVPYDPLNEVISKLSNTYFPGKGSLISRMNVGDFLVNLCSYHLQYRHLAFAGIDFCYIGNKSYAVGVEHADPYYIDKQKTMPLNIHGRDVETTNIMVQYANSFSEICQKIWMNKSTMYNLSSGLLAPTNKGYKELEDFLYGSTSNTLCAS